MDPTVAVQLALGLLAAGTRAWDRHQQATAALQAAVAENRPPTAEEWEQLRQAGVDVDRSLEARLAASPD